MKEYNKLIKRVLRYGTMRSYYKGSGADIGTRAIFNYQQEFDLREGFPLVTTKKVKFEHVVNELLWFISGSSNVRDLIQKGTNIWNDNLWDYTQKYIKRFEEYLQQQVSQGVDLSDVEYWVPDTKEELLDHLRSDEELIKLPNGYTYGDIGFMYSSLWRDFPVNPNLADSADQLELLLSGLLADPMRRDHVVSAWHPALVTEPLAQALKPCHILFQAYCDPIPRKKLLKQYKEDFPEIVHFNTKTLRPYLQAQGKPVYYLDLSVVQRSADVFLGVPFNWASYALLTHLIAKCTNMVARKLIWTGNDVHIYKNHMDQVKEVISREPRPKPRLLLAEGISAAHHLFDITSNDIGLEGYNPHPYIPAKMAVANY